VGLSIPKDARERKNPVTDAEAWRQVLDHYQDHCAVCHGTDGRATTEIAANMYPRVSDLTSRDTQDMSDGALFYVIQNGVRWTGMPAWKNEHSEEETWKLVSLIRRMPTLAPGDFEAGTKSDAVIKDRHEQSGPAHREHGQHPE
jgi:mono/diheme cytochrome c family protein